MPGDQFILPYTSRWLKYKALSWHIINCKAEPESCGQLEMRNGH